MPPEAISMSQWEEKGLATSSSLILHNPINSGKLLGCSKLRFLKLYRWWKPQRLTESDADAGKTAGVFTHFLGCQQLDKTPSTMVPPSSPLTPIGD